MGLHTQDDETSVTSRGETILGWGWGCTTQPFTLASVGCCPSFEVNCWYPQSQSTQPKHKHTEPGIHVPLLCGAGRGQVTQQIASTLETGPPFSPIYSSNMNAHPRPPVTIWKLVLPLCEAACVSFRPSVPSSLTSKTTPPKRALNNPDTYCQSMQDKWPQSLVPESSSTSW